MAADGLHREQIVRAAIDLLDADGVDGLSMRKLGVHLGSGATSVYWHVGNKDNLVALAADEVFGELDLPDPAETGWRDAVAGGAREMRAAIVRHPWLAPVLYSHPEIHGPHIARYQNHSLIACELAGFTGADLFWAGSTVFSFVIGTAWGEVSSTAHGTRDWSAVVERARTSAAQFPRLLDSYDVLTSADPATVPEQSFEFGLRAVIDGLAARLTGI